MDQRELIEDLDGRQNDVIERLAQLNSRVESLLNECLTARNQASKAVDTYSGPIIRHEASSISASAILSDPSAPISQSPATGAGPATR
jgi:hypothetical protein